MVLSERETMRRQMYVTCSRNQLIRFMVENGAKTAAPALGLFPVGRSHKLSCCFYSYMPCHQITRCLFSSGLPCAAKHCLFVPLWVPARERYTYPQTPSVSDPCTVHLSADAECISPVYSTPVRGRRVYLTRVRYTCPRTPSVSDPCTVHRLCLTSVDGLLAVTPASVDGLLSVTPASVDGLLAVTPASVDGLFAVTPASVDGLLLLAVTPASVDGLLLAVTPASVDGLLRSVRRCRVNLIRQSVRDKTTQMVSSLASAPSSDGNRSISDPI